MTKYALVKLEGTSRQYCFWTIVDGLEKGNYVLVDTQNGLLLGEFIRYTTQTQTTSKATRWLYKAISRIQLRKYLKTELEECGINYYNPAKVDRYPVKVERYEAAKKMVEDSRNREAMERIRKIYTDNNNS